METFMSYLLLLPLLPFSLYLIFFIRKKCPSHRKTLPPGSEGWPILGENVEFILSGAQQLVRDRMQRSSPDVFKTSLLGEKMAVICGAPGNKFVFRNEHKLVTPWLPLSMRKTLLPDFDEARHQELSAAFHRIQYDVLKPEALRRHVPVADALAREHLRDEWNPNPAVKVLPSTSKYAFELACRVFMNVVDRERLGKLLEPFSLLSNGMLSLPLNLPGTPFNRAVGAGKVVRGEIVRIVRERRQEMMRENEEREGRDFLSKLLVAVNEDGECMSDNKVANMVVGLLVASQFEVSCAITIVVKFLAELPHIYNEVLKEQTEIAKSKGSDKLLTWEDVQKMRYTWNVVRECFRLTPPSIGGFREAATEITYAGFTIPKGWKIMWTAHSSHRNPKYFPEPEKFDPSRFEGSGPAPYTYTPFGGGATMCPGRGYVKLVIMAFIHNLVTSFRFEKVIPSEKMMFHRTSPVPAYGLPLRIHPHQK